MTNIATPYDKNPCPGDVNFAISINTSSLRYTLYFSDLFLGVEKNNFEYI